MDYLSLLQAYARRNARIARLYGTKRYTLEDLAEQFSMSKQRVSIIVKRHLARRNGKR